MQMRWDIEHNPHKYRSNTSGGCAGFCLPTTWSPLKIFLLIYFYSPGGMLCVSASIGWCRTKQLEAPEFTSGTSAFIIALSVAVWNNSPIPKSDSWPDPVEMQEFLRAFLKHTPICRSRFNPQNSLNKRHVCDLQRIADNIIVLQKLRRPSLTGIHAS